MKDWQDVVVLIVGLSVIFGMFYFVYQDRNECNEKQGFLVQCALGYECVKNVQVTTQ